MTMLFRSPIFYPALFVLWAMALFFRYSNYQYFNKPLPTAGYEFSENSGISKMGYVPYSLHVLKTRLLTKCKAEDIPHLLGNIGTGYFEIYSATGDRKVLDTIIFYLMKSVDLAPEIPRFHYTLGRAFTEVGDHEKALYHYEQTIRLDPHHALARSNAGMTAFFVLNRKDLATRYFLQALAVDSLQPTCHLMLGLISAAENNFSQALQHFEAEIAAGQKLLRINRFSPLSSNVEQAVVLARFNLFELYSKQLRNKTKALANFDAYLRLEQDTARKNEALAAFRKHWGKEPGSF